MCLCLFRLQRKTLKVPFCFFHCCHHSVPQHFCRSRLLCPTLPPLAFLPLDFYNVFSLLVITLMEKFSCLSCSWHCSPVGQQFWLSRQALQTSSLASLWAGESKSVLEKGEDSSLRFPLAQVMVEELSPSHGSRVAGL